MWHSSQWQALELTAAASQPPRKQDQQQQQAPAAAGVGWTQLIRVQFEYRTRLGVAYEYRTRSSTNSS
eukprot:COSAG01_NODE_8658_length_2705_cov_19.586723_5_plen_68_part_00